MKIGMRLHLGFGCIILVLLAMYFLSKSSLERMEDTQSTLKVSSQLHNKIAKIDSMIERLQRYIILYAGSGMNSVHSDVFTFSEEIISELNDINKLELNSAQETKIIQNMRDSLQLLIKQFKRAAEDRTDRDTLLQEASIAIGENLEQPFSQLQSDPSIPLLAKNQIIDAQLNLHRAQQQMLRYITSPDSKYSKASRRYLALATKQVSRLIKDFPILTSNSDLTTIASTLKAYKKQKAIIIRLTRGYLFIFNSVIAGQASEFSRSSNELKQISLNRRETLFEHLHVRIDKFSSMLEISAIFSIIFGLFCAWYTARSIVSPLQRITATFTSLSKGQNVQRIPGLTEKNEIGDMAKSAQVFKDKNQQTEELLVQAHISEKNLLESRNQLKSHQENLEVMVSERTRQLEESIDNLQRTQGQLAKSERMAAIGNMVQGVAHELNTPVGLALTAVTHIKSDSEQLQKNVNEGKLTKTSLSDHLESNINLASSMFTSLAKAAQLIKSFKLVSVNEHHERLQTFMLADNLDNLLASMRRSIDRKYEIENRIPRDIQIENYPGVFYQIYTNLMNNSVLHGFDGRDQGNIIIDARIEGEMLVLDYKDNGVGMDEETKRNLYEAFFTTKRARGGTGLGMNIVQALVTDKLHGEIELLSTLGEGTQYIFRIPLQLPKELIATSDKGQADSFEA